MSIASEITRLQGVKADILTAIADKGVTVPAGSALDDCPRLIASIPTGGGEIPDGYTPVRYLKVNGENDACFRYNGTRAKYSDKITADVDFVLSDDFISDYRSFTLFYFDSITNYFYTDYRSNKQGFHFDFYSNEKNIDIGAVVKTVESSITEVLIERVANFTINGNTQTLNNVSDREYSLLFLDYSNYQYYVGTKIYSLKIYKGNTTELKYDYRPVIRNSDSRPGLYDVVNGVFWKTGQYSYTPTGVSAGPIIT